MSKTEGQTGTWDHDGFMIYFMKIPQWQIIASTDSTDKSLFSSSLYKNKYVRWSFIHTKFLGITQK